MTFEKANELLRGRNKLRRKLGNNTYLERNGADICVRLHATIIILFQPDGVTMLDSGGWRTVTTKARLNEHGPVNITSERGVWYVSIPNTKYRGWEETPEETYWKRIAVFTDGMRVLADGSIEGAPLFSRPRDSGESQERW